MSPVMVVLELTLLPLAAVVGAYCGIRLAHIINILRYRYMGHLAVSISLLMGHLAVSISLLIIDIFRY